MIKLCLFLLSCVVFAQGQSEGTSCSFNGQPGVCRLLPRCQSALEDIKRRRYPQTCSYATDGFTPIVCCVEAAPPPTPPPTPRPTPPPTARPTPAPTPRPRPQTTTEYIPASSGDEDEDEICPTVHPSLTSPKTGRKAFDKCIEYQEKYVYPCVKKASLLGGKTRANYCKHNADPLIVGGMDADKNEFLHMALLGFGDNVESAAWSCGGSIISERFIMTAGHCTYDRFNGDVKYVAVGVYKRTDKWDANTQIYNIKRVISHPDYHPPSSYNDIALLELDRDLPLSSLLVPACLDIGDGVGVDNDKGVATGWGALKNKGVNADALQKVILQRFTSEECFESFPESRFMKQGYQDRTQICYGDHTQSKDACQGDSGGPIQTRNTVLKCMYTVVGVTSTGSACGVVNEPGIYTRVATFAPWIESVVWP